MTNKRNLKKDINRICRELFAECMATSLYIGKPDNENANALLFSILTIRNNYVRRISHPEPGMPAKQYYKDLIEKFNKEVSEIIDQICNLAQ